MKLTRQEEAVLTALQRGVEPVERPFCNMPLPEDAVVDLLQRAQAEGLIRRFGGVFDARRLGYKSVLCAVDIDESQMEQTAEMIAAHPGVTHCYERRPVVGGREYPVLWFTLALLHDRFDEGLAQMQMQLGAKRVLLLPALRRFKIDVVFDLRTQERDETFPGAAAPASAQSRLTESFESFTEDERAIVRALEGNLAVSARPFDAAAGQLGIPVSVLLARLNDWRRKGVLRRVGVILYHREAGFKANGMCVWPVEGDIVAAGRRVASRPEVTHCYQRPRLPGFPFDLYAMIHTGSPAETKALFDKITAACGLPDGELFISLREFKKSSMHYFQE